MMFVAVPAFAAVTPVTIPPNALQVEAIASNHMSLQIDLAQGSPENYTVTFVSDGNSKLLTPEGSIVLHVDFNLQFYDSNNTLVYDAAAAQGNPPSIHTAEGIKSISVQNLDPSQNYTAVVTVTGIQFSPVPPMNAKYSVVQNMLVPYAQPILQKSTITTPEFPITSLALIAGITTTILIAKRRLK